MRALLKVVSSKSASVSSLSLQGTDGNDTLVGGAGSDLIIGYDGQDSLSGLEGNDTLYGGNGNDTLSGGIGRDLLLGELGDDYIEGDSDDDELVGGGGRDSLFGGSGNDSLSSGRVLLNGVFVDDTLGDTLDGGAGNDQVSGGGGDDLLRGGEGNDEMNGGGGSDNISGDDGDDNMYGGPGNDAMNGGAGSDRLDGDEGNDMLDGGDGSDSLNGGGGSDVLFGGAGNDSLVSGVSYVNGQAVLDALGDLLEGGAGDDFLLGGDADDTLLGGTGNDTLSGGSGNDSLVGGIGVDSLFGGTGNDTITVAGAGSHAEGGAGNDILEALGRATLVGGEGDDVYVIRDADVSTEEASDGGQDVAQIYVDGVKVSRNIETAVYHDGAVALPYYLNALTHLVPLEPALWATGTIKYAFLQSDLNNATFRPFTTDEIALTKAVFKLYEGVSGLKFEHVPDGPTMQIRFSVVDLGDGIPALGGGNGKGGHVKLDDGIAAPGTDTANEQYQWFFRLLIHEIGHVLGLSHPGNYNGKDFSPYDKHTLLPYEDVTSNSLMSYFTDPNAPQPSGLGAFDIGALQYFYGVNKNYNAGDNIYDVSKLAWPSTLIGDGAGNDTLDASGVPEGTIVHLDLRPGHRSTVGAFHESITASGQLSINFGSVVENAIGTRGADILTGNGTSNFLHGGGGNDTLIGGGGNDTLSGGEGHDVAKFAGNRNAYEVVFRDGVAIVTAKSGSDGVDTLQNVERLLFADGAIGLDIGDNGGIAYRLYRAAFARTPDEAGLGYWIAQMDKGLSQRDLAANFMSSTEFKSLYGDQPSNDALLSRIYQNVLGRAPDQAGYDFWLQKLTEGVDSALILAHFSESPENSAAVLQVIGNGFAFQPWG